MLRAKNAPREDSMPESHESLRADAQLNRDRIVEVARHVLAASSNASLNSIAKKAGVGPGTLYRHFPNREALVLAVYRHEVQQLADLAPQLVEDHPPLVALRLWFDRLAYYGRIKHSLAGVLHAATSEGLVGETYGPVIGAITLLLHACEEAGTLRADIDADDVLLMVGFLWRLDSSNNWEERASRMLDLVMDGLRGEQPGTADEAPVDYGIDASERLAEIREDDR
jgi:AcrR family transcriptional regulator